MARNSILFPCFVLICAWLTLPSIGAADPLKPEITWMVSGMPLLYGDEERMRTESYNEAQLRYLVEHLGGFNHKNLSGSLPRSIYMMEHADGYCTQSAMRSPEREKHLAFSRRPLPFPSFRLVLRRQHLRDLQPYINQQGEVELSLLADAAALRGGYNASRLYPATVEDFIGNHQRNSPLEKIMSTRQLFNLIHDDRLLYGFALPIEVTFIQTIPDESFRQFITLPIAGTPRTVDGYVACSNGPVGSAAIEAINALLDNDQHWQEFVAPLRSWVPSQEFLVMQTAFRG